MKKRLKGYLAILTVIILIFSGCSDEPNSPGGANDPNGNKHQNQYVSHTQVKEISEGISWPEGQALPTFSTPAEVMKTVSTGSLSKEERVTFSAFQGLVNKDKTEILLTEAGDVDQYTWPKTLKLERENHSSKEKRYELIKSYADKIKGLVVYDPDKSPHYRNAAATIANVNGYLPVDGKVRDNLSAAGLTFEDSKIIDITTWAETTALDIYTKIYNDYWKDCSKRLLILANPGVKDTDGNTPHDLDHCRDIAAAVGAAVIFPDTADNQEEKTLFEKFVKDMADDPSTSMILGWGVSERSAITSSSKYGIGIVPANFYISASVYSATNHTINIPAVPQRPALGNKVYITVYVSDGDNIQYVQRAMRKFWDNEKSQRGKVAINWTIAPSLVDIGPGLLNYYYDGATELDCFVSGPSGISYLMPTNTGGGKGEANGIHLSDEKYSNDFTSITETYLERSGIRVLTIWDDASPVVRSSMAKNCRYLYGATVQQFGQTPKVEPSVENNRLSFDKLRICYSGDYNGFLNDASSQIKNWSRSKSDQPLFISYQLDRWHAGPSEIVKLEKELKEKYPDVEIEFVRADHYYSYYNEQNNLPFNLNMLSDTTVTSSDEASEVKNTVDGTPRTVWSSAASGAQLNFDFGKEYQITRYLLRHAETAGLDPSQNTKAWKVEYSKDGESWSEMDVYKGNTAAVTDIDLNEAVTARYIRFTFTDSGDPETARIADVEIYGKKV